MTWMVKVCQIESNWPELKRRSHNSSSAGGFPWPVNRAVYWKSGHIIEASMIVLPSPKYWIRHLMIYFGRMIDMEKTWIAKLLPQDEYRQKRLLYFFAEATVILGGVLFVYSFLTSFISAMDVPGLAIALLSWLD